jgi:hypothetical protein
MDKTYGKGQENAFTTQAAEYSEEELSWIGD